MTGLEQPVKWTYTNMIKAFDDYCFEPFTFNARTAIPFLDEIMNDFNKAPSSAICLECNIKPEFSGKHIH